jgi:hypothetical protein
MASSLEQLEQARRHVIQARRIAEAQRERVDRLTKQGQDTRDAQSLLRAYEQALTIFEDEFVQLSKKVNV